MQLRAQYASPYTKSLFGLHLSTYPLLFRIFFCCNNEWFEDEFKVIEENILDGG